MSARFPAQRRLRKRREYLAVQADGVKHQTRYFTILTVDRDDSRGAPGRVGITVSRRVGSAVTRNRIKRLVRELVRSTDWLPAGRDVVVIAKPRAGEIPGLRELAADLESVRGRLA